jgi:type III pantothenate kinase
MPLLAIDVGNSRLKWGLYNGLTPLATNAVDLEQINNLHLNDWANFEPPSRIVGSNVAGESARQRVEDQVQRWGGSVDWISPASSQLGVTNGYDRPALLGADRWASLLSARSRVPAQPCLIITVGTAVTMDSISAQGMFLGGMILPGFGLMLQALESGTAGLRVPSGDFQRFPTNTSNALMSGGIHALAGAAERVRRLLREESGETPIVLLSGGASTKLAEFLPFNFQLVENLVLEGVVLIANSQHDT